MSPPRQSIRARQRRTPPQLSRTARPVAADRQAASELRRRGAARRPARHPDLQRRHRRTDHRHHRRQRLPRPRQAHRGGRSRGPLREQTQPRSGPPPTFSPNSTHSAPQSANAPRATCNRNPKTPSRIGHGWRFAFRSLLRPAPTSGNRHSNPRSPVDAAPQLSRQLVLPVRPRPGVPNDAQPPVRRQQRKAPLNAFDIAFQLDSPQI